MQGRLFSKVFKCQVFIFYFISSPCILVRDDLLSMPLRLCPLMCL